MLRRILGAFVVCCWAAICAHAEEAGPTLDQLAEKTAANVAAFDNLYCEFDVKIGHATSDKDFRNVSFQKLNGVGHGVWAKKGPIELYDFRQEGESNWEQGTHFAYGPVIYTEALIRYPGYEMRIQKNAVITSAPNDGCHPRMDPLSLFHIVEGELNTRLPELLSQLVLERDSEVGANMPKPQVSLERSQDERLKLEQFRIITPDRNVTIEFEMRNYGCPTYVDYSYRKSEGTAWRKWRMYVLDVARIDGVGMFPKKILIVHPEFDLESARRLANRGAPNFPYVLLWELKTVECREPTADELTFKADRDLPVMRAGFARVTYVNEDETITPDQLPGLFKELQNKPPKKPGAEEEEKSDEEEKREATD
ncbi:hypothetical protein LOC68_16430 [Blastopirellula sp. JC732]|uniref:Outer membrane lipoprotein-sorting protein n=1 Tax=Blastopirellula sediminis TaxID=2894196 RepID=A0A9X1SGA0_9BACT|nr:hypothetical protein [Blastopirellula sediminis]MCC9606723.1 hypothetical protein [Blastopirellula sediminis]MCC9629980.1 hypothetical protein [Blastopirellula sediminis]